MKLGRELITLFDIYRRATKDKSLNPKERERIVSKLETADCRRLVNAFIKAGISEAETIEEVNAIEIDYGE